MPSAYRDNFISFIPICKDLTAFDYITDIVSTPSTILNRCGES